MDPLFSDYAWNSVYAFSENQVIAFIEMEGLEKSVVKRRSKPILTDRFDGGGLLARLFGKLRPKYTKKNWDNPVEPIVVPAKKWHFENVTEEVKNSITTYEDKRRKISEEIHSKKDSGIDALDIDVTTDDTDWDTKAERKYTLGIKTDFTFNIEYEALDESEFEIELGIVNDLGIRRASVTTGPTTGSGTLSLNDDLRAGEKIYTIIRKKEGNPFPIMQRSATAKITKKIRVPDL